MNYSSLKMKKARCAEIENRSRIIYLEPWTFFDDQPEYKQLIWGLGAILISAVISMVGAQLQAPRMTLLGLVALIVSIGISIYNIFQEPQDLKEYKRLRFEIQKEESEVKKIKVVDGEITDLDYSSRKRIPSRDNYKRLLP